MAEEEGKAQRFLTGLELEARISNFPAVYYILPSSETLVGELFTCMSFLCEASLHDWWLSHLEHVFLIHFIPQLLQIVLFPNEFVIKYSKSPQPYYCNTPASASIVFFFPQKTHMVSFSSCRIPYLSWVIVSINTG